jgi:hypothetical protein
MKAYIFFSVHEELFHRVAQSLEPYGVDRFSGFAWSRWQMRALEDRGVVYEDVIVFTRDLLPKCDDGAAPDLEWLARRERELGVSIQRMLAAERHLLKGRDYTQIMRMAEVALKEIAAALDRAKPDFIFSEDVSCFHSYAHYVLAQERGIPFWCIGTGRLPRTVSVYSKRFQHLEMVEARYAEIRARGLTADERTRAEAYVSTFRDRPAQPTGMNTRAKRPKVELADIGRFKHEVSLYLGDRGNPTATPPLRVIHQRFRRMARVQLASAVGVFERPVPGEKYILYPIHFQPEASTLVQAPMYLDQIQLLQDIAKSLPAGYRLYVKEHMSNRGRRPLEFYRAIKDIYAVRLLGPDEDTWTLIKNSSAIAVITGTMGWEGLLFDKPVITFGDAWFGILPQVIKASDSPKDAWFELIRDGVTTAIPDHESVLQLVAALQQATSPGFMGNPRTMEGVLEDQNVANITHALVRAAGLQPSQPAESTRSEAAATRT